MTKETEDKIEQSANIASAVISRIMLALQISELFREKAG
jgi:hypothetical protein